MKRKKLSQCRHSFFISACNSSINQKANRNWLKWNWSQMVTQRRKGPQLALTTCPTMPWWQCRELLERKILFFSLSKCNFNHGWLKAHYCWVEFPICNLYGSVNYIHFLIIYKLCIKMSLNFLSHKIIHIITNIYTHHFS